MIPASHRHGQRRQHRLATALLCLGLGLRASVALGEEDAVACTLERQEVICDVDVHHYFEHEINATLNNGWENLLRFRLYLMDEDDEVLAISYAELSQRCYIDPFDSPCMAIWAESETLQKFDDLDAMIDELGQFWVRFPLDEVLPEDGARYSVKFYLDVNPITDEQINVVRSWLAKNRGGHLVVTQGNKSVFGTFVSVFANIRPGSAEATLEMKSLPIVVTATPPEDPGGPVDGPDGPGDDPPGPGEAPLEPKGSDEDGEAPDGPGAPPEGDPEDGASPAPESDAP